MMNGRSLGRGLGDAATETLPAIKKKPLPEWAAASYCRGPFPRKLKEPCASEPMLADCFTCSRMAWPVRVDVSVPSLAVMVMSKV